MAQAYPQTLAHITAVPKAEPTDSTDRVSPSVWKHLVEGPFNFTRYAKKHRDEETGRDMLICKFCEKIYTGQSRTSMKRHFINMHFSRGELTPPGEDEEWQPPPAKKPKKEPQITPPKLTKVQKDITTMWKCKFCAQTFPAGSITVMERHLVFAHSDELGANSPLIARHQAPAPRTAVSMPDEDDEVTIVPALSGPINITPQVDQPQNQLSVGRDKINVGSGGALKCRYCEARYTDVSLEELQEHLVTKHPDVIAQCLAGVPSADTGQGSSSVSPISPAKSPIAANKSPIAALLNAPVLANKSPIAALLNAPVTVSPGRSSIGTVDEQLSARQAASKILTILPTPGDSQMQSDTDNDSSTEGSATGDLSPATIKMLKNKMLDYAKFVDVVVDRYVIPPLCNISRDLFKEQL